MNIRSITVFVPRVSDISSTGVFAREARAAYESAGFPVQTVRIATAPFPSMLEKLRHAAGLARKVEKAIREAGIDYASLGPGTGAWISAIPDMLAAAETVFASAVIASPQKGIDFQAVEETARVVREVSRISPDGFANLRLAALCNVPPGAPFFPAAYHSGGAPSFAVATEAANLAVSAFDSAKTLEEARQNLISTMEFLAGQMVSIARSLAFAHHIEFAGIDFSLAPFPQEKRSIGRALEMLSGASIGAPGTLAAAAFVTRAVEDADFPRCGFCGLMLPVLEDAVLARRAAEGVLSLGDLLQYSAVCGTGLDTVPLPGDIPQGVLAAILLDVATLALRLDKPLTARLMPLPGKSAGDEVSFDFPWFAGSRVMQVPAERREASDGGLFSSLLGTG